MKKWLWTAIIVLVLAGLGTWFYFAWLVEPATQRKAIYQVPADAILILETDDPFEGWKQLSTSAPLHFLLSHPKLIETAQAINDFNARIRSTELLADYVASRDVMISLHPVPRKGSDFLYIIDLENVTKLAPVRSYIGSVLGKGYEVSHRDYASYEIMELYDKGSKSTIYLSFIDNLLLVSFTHTLIEHSIDEMATPVIGRDLAFVEVNQQVSYDGLLRCYINYEQINHLLDATIDSDAFLTALQKATLFTGLNVDVSDEKVQLRGYTAMSDSVTSYVRTLLAAGGGQRSAYEVAPTRTTLYLSLGFSDFGLFMDEMEQLMATDPEEAAYYQDNLARVERFLDISLREDFGSWIDEELAIVKIAPGEEKKEDEMALIIKASSGEKAKEKLDYITRQIKKKTPVRFRSFQYKGFEINYLSIKGFFKLFLGKLFQDLEKPYYTIIDDYVIFSNQPYTLRGIINDYNREATLGADRDFVEFNRSFDEESSLFAYFNTQNGLTDARPYLEDKTFASLSEQQVYLNAFPQMALLLKDRNQLAYTELQIAFSTPPPLPDPGQQTDPDITSEPVQRLAQASPSPPSSQRALTAVDSMFIQAEESVTEEEQIVPEEILPDDLTASKHQEHFTNGQLKLEVALKNGLKHGSYREYDSLGNVIVKGRYREDQPHGIWKQYDSLGNLTNRVRYRNGEAVN